MKTVSRNRWPMFDVFVRLLHCALQDEATEAYLAVGMPPMLRINGRLRDSGNIPLTPDDTLSLMKMITPENAQRRLRRSGSCKYVVNMPGATFLIDCCRQKGLYHFTMKREQD